MTAGEGHKGKRGIALGLAAACFLATLALGVVTAVAVAPAVTVQNASSVEYTTAKVNGTVDTQNESTAYRFQYLDEAAYQQNLAESKPPFEGAVNGVEGSLPASTSGPQAVSGELTGLTAHTTYHLRLLAENADGADEAVAASTFETKEAAAPLVDHTYVSGVGTEEATLNAAINPRGATTTYRFQYTTEAAFEANGFSGAAETQPATLEGKANPDDLGQAKLEGLEPDTAYRFRVLAENAKGSVTGETRWLHTYAIHSEAPETCPNAARRIEQHSTFLPDCRAYEMVSPPDKSSGDVMINSLRTWAAADGNAAAFASLTGFGDVAGTGVATDYLAQRSANPNPGTNGWSTHAITPSQGALPLALTEEAFEPMDLAFTPNLDAGVYQSWDPLTSDPYVAGVANLYLRRGFRTAPSPAVDLVTACPACVLSGDPLAPFARTPFSMLPKLAGLSADGTHVLFESTLKLTPNATDGTSSGQINLYEYANGAVQNVGILPNGEPAPGAIAGQGAGAGQGIGFYLPQTLSRDGARVAFTADPAVRRMGVDQYMSGDLYLRDTSSTPPSTIQINGSERTPPDPGGPQPAVFWAMSGDGRRVFFTTAEQLTNDDNNPNVDLYVFDAGAPAGSRLTRISVQDPSLPGANVDIVLGASDDGRTVYFTSSGPLLPGDPSFGTLADSNTEGIYMWSDAGSGPPQLRFVAPLFGHSFENRAAGVAWGPSYLMQSRVSPDGRFLLFSTTNGNGVLSRYGQSDYDQGTCSDVVSSLGCRELYLYDAQATAPQQQMQCVSCRIDGATATVSATDTAHAFLGASESGGMFDHALTPDGHVFFSTAEALVLEDTNGKSDAYEWQNGHVHLLSDGRDPSPSFFLDASPDGSNVFLATRARLTGWDGDGSYDLYDARAGGGFPEPPSASAPCAGPDTCRGPGAAAPPPVAPVTPRFIGPPNQLHHRKHHRRRHHRKHHRRHASARVGGHR